MNTRQDQRARSEADAVVDAWLSRALRDRFFAVAAEPLPDELLRLLDGQGGPRSETSEEQRAA